MFKSVDGFSAIEMAIVLSISAMIMGGGLAASKPVLVKMQKEKTERQMEKINDHLASYVHRNNRLPCPADPSAASEPFGAERGSGAAGSDAGTCTSTDAVGVVPFRTLGLQEDDVRDSWGNFITYHVSPAFAINPSNIVDSDHDQIYEMCRSSDWVNGSGSGGWDSELAFKRNDFREIEDDPALHHKRIYFSEYTSSDGDITYSMTTESGYPPVFSWQDHGDLGSEEDIANSGIGPTAYWKFYYDKHSVLDFKDPVSLFQVTVGEMANNLNDGHTIGMDVKIWVDEDVNSDGVIDDNDYMIDEIPVTAADLNDDGHALVQYDANDPDSIAAGKKMLKVEIGSDRNYNFDGTGSGDYGLRVASHTIINIKASASGNLSGSENINPAKARFCCPPAHIADYAPATDLRIVDGGGVPVWAQTRETTAGGRYDDKDTGATTSVSSNVIVPAFALVSHGPNAHGAYQGNGLNNRITVSGSVGEGFGSDEVSNSDGDNTYVYRMADKTSDASYYDDVVMWRTQDQVYSEFGNQSCQTP